MGVCVLNIVSAVVNDHVDTVSAVVNDHVDTVSAVVNDHVDSVSAVVNDHVDTFSRSQRSRGHLFQVVNDHVDTVTTLPMTVPSLHVFAKSTTTVKKIC